MKKKILLFIGLVLSLAYSTGVNAQCTAPLTITPTGNTGEVQLEYDLGSVASPSTFVGEVYFNHATVPGYNAYAVILQGNNPDLLTLPAGGTYNVTSFTYDSLGGCMDTIMYSYTDNSQGLPCNISINSYATDSNSTNVNYYFEAVGSFSGSATFVWNFGDGNSSTTNPTTHIYSPTGAQVYNVTVTVTDGGNTCTATTSVLAGVQAPPPACDANFYMWQDSLNGAQWYAYNYSTGNNLSYFWDFGDGTTSSQQFPNHTYTTPGSYNVCLTVDDGNGCSDTHCDIILVTNKAATEVHLNILDPDNPTANIEEINEIKDVFVYPNPTEGDFTIQYTSLVNKVTMVEIIDAKGSLVYDTQINSQTGLNTIDIDLSGIEKGMYFYRIDSDFVGKVLVK